MEISWNIQGDDLNISLEGRFDTMSALDLDEKFGEIPDSVVNIFFDFNNLTYIASAGLRVLYYAQEITENKGGKMSIRNVSKEVLEVLEVTGFDEFINIE